MEPAHTFEHAGLTVEIHYDDDPQHADPREYDGNLGVMFCDHRRYRLGDKDAEDPRGHMADCDCGDDEPNPKCPKCDGWGEYELSPHEYVKRAHGATVVLPLFLLDHSGISMRCGGNLLTSADDFDRRRRFVGDEAGWDTSSVGIIYDTNETRAQTTLTTPEQVEKGLREEVECYAALLENQVYGYIVRDEDGDEAESCWGFLEVKPPWSDEARVVQEAKQMAEYARKQIEHERAEAHRWACADVMTV